MKTDGQGRFSSRGEASADRGPAKRERVAARSAADRLDRMKCVLITGGRAPVALDLARHFMAGGWRVIAADSASCFLAGGSRATSKRFRVPPPRQAPEAFARAIGDIMRRERVDR